MGKKSKQARVKNNAKPSNSSRSAELLGNTVPAFVGFSAQSDLGLMPFAPGFNDSAVDSPEANIDPQLQLILRKMSKKDSVTKVKALQEFRELLNTYDVDTIKSILPLWPKLYQNLANDVDHRVRESVQEVMNIMALKCKKSMAPYLKQLVPIWLSSNFDNYAPAASTATSGFYTTFGSNDNKVREVCIFCQNEIVDYTMRNLTFHSATTLSSTKNCTPEEAEQKYQRVVSCSLKTLSFFLKVTSNTDIGKVQKSLQEMLDNTKYWSFAKSKVAEVKASWFEVLYYMLQNISLVSTLDVLRTKIVAVCFQNIDESEPLVVPHVWGCILLVQSQYKDWHDSVNFKKAVIPKLSSFLRNGCNKNTNVICVNLLPFLSKLTQETFKEINLYDFYEQFFDDIKIALTTLQNSSKSDYSALTTAYFECLRYIIQKVNIGIQEQSADTDIEVLKIFSKRLLNENIISLLKWSLTNEALVVKYVILHTSILIAFWADPEKVSDLYLELLNIFWDNIKAFILAGLIERKDDEIFLNHVIELCDKLYCATPKLEDQKVKFAVEPNDTDTPTHDQITKPQTAELVISTSESPSTESLQVKRSNNRAAVYIESDLKNLVIQLVHVCLVKNTNELSSKFLFKIHKLLSMFNDADFYAQISEEKTIMGTLKIFLKILDNVDDAACDDVIDITFEILNFLTKEEKLNFIEQNLLKIKHHSIQNSVINRLLSYPLNTEPKVRSMLSHPDARNIVIRLAEDVIKNNSKDSLNLFRKCFFQNDAGAIPIDIITADEVLKIISQPLSMESEMEHLMDECGSFIAQIMPVICSASNCSAEIQQDIFLKLFKFSIEHTPDDFISEDTLWEISTSWQDALSSQDISADTHIIHQCKEIVAKCLQYESLSIEIIELIAESVSQFMICSTEHILNEKERLHHIDITIVEFFNLCADKTQRIQEFCLFLEALLGKVTAGSELHDNCMENLQMVTNFRQTLLNSCIVHNLVYKSDKLTKSSFNENDDDNDYCDAKKNVLKQWSDTFYHEAIRCINMASVGDALIKMIDQIDPHLETAILQLSVKLETLLREGPEDFAQNLKERLFEIAAKEDTISASRSLLQLVHIEQYAQFEENATILLLEELTEYLVSRNSLKAYVNALQYLLPHLSSKVITAQTPIMKTNPSVLWIKAAVFRCLVQNNFYSDYNEKSDQNIIAHTLQFLTEVSEKQHANKELLLYNVEIQNIPFESVVNAVEFMNILREVINKFPYELTIKNWDAIRIGLSSWVLSVSKSLDHVKNPQVALFAASVFRLYESFANFIQNEKQKSSTLFLQSIIDEWENLFDREVNLVLFKTYYKLVETQELAIDISTCYNTLLEVLTPAMQLLNYGIVFNFYRTSTKITSDHVLQFLLKNLSNSLHCVRTLCVHVIHKITQFYVELDVETYDSKSECISSNAETGDWHFLCKFEDYIGRYSIPICKYINEYNFKLTEIAELKPIDRNEGLSYLFLWDCIIYACSNSPITLRSLYTNWLHENRYEENLLHFLFRAMPAEILKNHDSKIMLTDAFKGLTWKQIQDRNLAVEKYACHLYTEVLRKLPAVVRKWWNTCPSRQKTFVDKLTSNFVSPIICSEELKSIGNKKEKHENMQVTFHTSTREVLAVYSIDEARMELVITLAQNYPLGSVKVEIGKQIGGRLSSRNTGMQLTIFLTHQNGSIYDGLTLWKNNLDKKFEGVEECYVCYTVIHQDTCQLPKLTCKTCRKKFHGPCLYKWFTTSSKSTCPICRNIF